MVLPPREDLRGTQFPDTAVSPTEAWFFVDEAGDLTLFDARGRTIVGHEGVSHTFLVGAVELSAPSEVEAQLTELRVRLLADPYFRGVPSMQEKARKTALAFHAKDDLPEVRREVFRLLAALECKVFVAFRRKARLAEKHREHLFRTGTKRSPDAVYDELVSGLFKDRLHLADENRIVFARRGKSERTVALEAAIREAKRKFEVRWQKGVDRPTTIRSSTPSQTVGLQVIDYFLWALQRLIERGEDRFFALLASKYRLIIDRDDDRKDGFGSYYTSRNPLTLERMLPVLSARPRDAP